ncbi:hypothetical protein, partial [Lacticaseibacillus paracasei]|uniref:hypothetical protein n=2 Tax=Lacticaseibacillus paracasei TaxID=1597 RepID=UPI0022E8EACF
AYTFSVDYFSTPESVDPIKDNGFGISSIIRESEAVLNVPHNRALTKQALPIIDENSTMVGSSFRFIIIIAF